MTRRAAVADPPGRVDGRRVPADGPAAIELAVEVDPVLGTGGGRDAAFCLASGSRALVSEAFGDLQSDHGMAAYAAALDHYRTVLEIEPVHVAHDLHPESPTTRFAASLGIPALAVQHHHAHVAAVMAEHGLAGPVIGVAFDGFGLGHDGTWWGGEFLVGDARSMRRAGHLRAVRQPGGAAVAHSPLRMAVAHAADAGVLTEALRAMGTTSPDVRVALSQIGSGANAPWTSSAGRLFDAVAALTGVSRRSAFDGEPVTLLERAADESATFEYPFDVTFEAGTLVLDTRPIVAAIVQDLGHGRSAGTVAGRFHRTLTAAALTVCRTLRGETSLDRVCLGGGVFANDLLAADLAARLSASGFEVFAPRHAPVGDGGIALGQVLVAHATAVAEAEAEAEATAAVGVA